VPATRLLSHLERPVRPKAGLRKVLSDFGATYAANGFIGWVFSATAPVAIILSVGTQGGLSEAELASWIFGVFFINGLITILFCWLYRQPLAFFWTIPGTVLVGPALAHLSFPEVVGAFYVTGVLMLVLGVTGWVRRVMLAIPMPIVMGMVAGVFLRFGLDLVRALHNDIAIAGPMVLTFLILTAVPSLGRRMPPLIGALVVGAVVIALLGRLDTSALSPVQLARPVIQVPEWSWPALIELVVPLAITVLVVQNGQGMAVLKAVRHEPPLDAITVACGVGSIAAASVGAVSTCLTGPTTQSLRRRVSIRGSTPRASLPECWRWRSD
jgi:benzoate membrane transport protein